MYSSEGSVFTRLSSQRLWLICLLRSVLVTSYPPNQFLHVATCTSTQHCQVGLLGGLLLGVVKRIARFSVLHLVFSFPRHDARSIRIKLYLTKEDVLFCCLEVQKEFPPSPAPSLKLGGQQHTPTIINLEGLPHDDDKK